MRRTSTNKADQSESAAADGSAEGAAGDCRPEHASSSGGFINPSICDYFHKSPETSPSSARPDPPTQPTLPTTTTAPLPARRDVLKFVGLLTAGSAALASRSALAEASGHGHSSGPADPMGVLVDLSNCVGCRLCEHACKKANGIDPGPLESYDDPSVFRSMRRPSPNELTVVNAWPLNSTNPASPVEHQLDRASDSARQPARSALGFVYAKINCMHCNHAACVSACIVGALRKQPDGAVTYDAWKCIGCRYCMIACPFQLPAYSYEEVLTPEVRKCQFCHHRTTQGKLPACVEACPRNALLYGRRRELIALAHQRIEKTPGRYVDHVYGEHEVGGTSWMYLSPVPFEQAGFLKLGPAAPPALTEAIQHGVFKYWIAPIGWYSFLSGMMWWTGRRARCAKSAAEAHKPPARDQANDRREGDATTAGLRSLRHRNRSSAFARDSGKGSNPDGSDDGPAVAVLDVPESELSSDDVGGHEERPGGHCTHHDHAAPINHPLNTPGVWVLAILVLTGVGFGLYRFFVGLGASTNLDQQHPWGLWIAMDVGSGIALAGGGFVTAALVHIFHREHYHSIARSALLTALLGYTFYVPGLLADLGRWYNIWHPILPSMWQGNSVLFEVGICVMLYLNVQYAELTPIICQRLLAEAWVQRRPWLHRLIKFIHDQLELVMPALLVLGVTLSTFHQSSLGNLMVIAPYKLHELWWTPISPILFLWSAMMVGFPMVIFTILFASWSLNRRPEMHVLSPLAMYVPFFLAIYLVMKVADVIWRGAWADLVHLNTQGALWLTEMTLGVAIPLVLLLIPKVRRTPGLLAAAVFCVIVGVVLNRLNVFVLGYQPPFASKTYIPSITEFAVSTGLVAALLLTYRVGVTYLPILEPRPAEVRP
ncbi:4Fe-4S dicluster domain-containing protein [Fontivita pretiosa]|uniref:4Fe-4S dicluster domain-containing protein n=1 Tax=Fontivita pretiosa TaxID=2989684 RepID=UPI003D162CEE